MGTSADTITYLLEQLAGVGGVTARKMFGEYALYCDGKVVALVCDEQLFLKITDGGTAFAGGVEEGIPYPGAKPWNLIDGDRWEDGEWLSALIKITASELPMPKKKRPRSAGNTGITWSESA